jgi:hypothetical protein
MPVSTAATSSTPSSTNFIGPGSGGNQSPSTVNNDWAYNGTSLASITFSTTADTTGTNYVVFFQHSNGDIRMTVWNNSIWHDSEFVTDDAMPGTPISVYWKGDNFAFDLFYLDKNSVVQEIRGSQSSSTWLNGTLGQLRLVAEPSALSVIYVGGCNGVDTAWIVYQTEVANVARIVYWRGDIDTWSTGDGHTDVKSGAGFSAHADLDMWRLYYISSQDSQLEELICPNCCSSSTPSWKQGMSFFSFPKIYPL